MFIDIGIIVFFVVLSIVVTPYARKHGRPFTPEEHREFMARMRKMADERR